MCGRYSLGLSHADIQEMHGYNVHVAQWVGQGQFQPRHNIAPRSRAPVLRRRESGEEGLPDGLVLQTMRWGLVPHWTKREDKTLKTANARRENIVEGGGMWQSIKGKRRCAVLCEGYYEWLKRGKERLPHFTRREGGQLMLLAGLYDCAELEGESEPLWTFTIVTTDANKDFQWLHDRQPVILSSTGDLNAWLDTSAQKWSTELARLLEPYHDSDAHLTCYQVPREVGKVGAESPTFIQPIAGRKDGIKAMFAQQTISAPSRPHQGDKRKRSASPPKQAKDEPPEVTNIRLSSTCKDAPAVEYLAGPLTSSATADKQPNAKQDTDYDHLSPSTPTKRARTVSKSTETIPKQQQAKRSDPSAKITSFFAKISSSSSFSKQ